MKIAMVTSALQSGAGRVITDLCIDLKNRGFESFVISSGNVDGSIDWENYIVQLQNAKIHYDTTDLFHRNTECFWNSVNFLTELFAKTKPDIIHAHGGVSALAAYLSSKMYNPVPVITSFYSWNINRPTWMNFADILAFRCCHRIIVATDYYFQFLLKEGLDHQNVSKIHLGLKTDLFSQYKRNQFKKELFSQYCFNSDDWIISMLAVIEPRKNQIAAIEALYHLIHKYGKESVKMIFIGNIKDQCYFDTLQNRIDQLNLGNSIVFTGYCNDPNPIIAESDAFVFPTLSEGLGIAILEAMILKTPVVSSCIEGTAEILRNNENCLTVDPNNPEDIAAKLFHVITNRELSKKLIQKAYDTVIHEFDWEQTLTQHIQLYENMKILE
ncbi:MAG: hypothetical protein A2161_02455 [Candidatus Schekmanbacteria bacterium RBG_13_48_7]|uniref:Glycosyltransferase subfamily 4-like N-terminal domain-containing protein n=1 Tax=Candidatus Schekmanbacteria bacterium RBG_13_48_7 TaxID=1817878 RepID=A0A1F7RY08_9BACT|nr:MAG: hypothetical protein A2161_02455 [Candidatus Schekmanbacteria bacterium RBG_13_48_7]